MTGAAIGRPAVRDGRPVPGCTPAKPYPPCVAARCPDPRRPAAGRPPDRAAPRRRDRGSVTAELAAALPALLLLFAVGVAAVSAAGVKLSCLAAARDAALSQARGGNGVDDGRRAAPDGARVEVTVEGDRARAVVSAELRPLGRHLPGVTVSATAVAAVEPGLP